MKEFDFPTTVDFAEAQDVAACVVVEVERGDYDLIAVYVRDNNGIRADVLECLSERQRYRLIEKAVKTWEG